jgi:protoheme IX farnesyltransferase
MWFDADIDALMRRTSSRPIPSGRVLPGEAFGFGIVLAIGAVAVMGLLVNWLAASLLAFTIFFYVAVYTMWLKRRTPQNIVIGGAAGALPPVIGWTAATGGLGVEPLLMFLIIFVWTPPHFWALSLSRCEEYARAGVPMWPVVAGKEATRRHILVYALLLMAVGIAPWPLGYAGGFYGILAAAAGAIMVALAVVVWRRQEGPRQDQAASQLFAFSILYLVAIFAALLFDRLGGLSGHGSV